MPEKVFVIILPSGARIDVDTVVSMEHSGEARATKYPIEATGSTPATSASDHVIIEPTTTAVEAIVSDSPLDITAAPAVSHRASAVWGMLESISRGGMVVEVFAGLRYYPRALLQRLTTTEDLSNSGWLRFKVTVQELLTSSSKTAKIKVKHKHKHKPKVQKGPKFKDKIKAVVEGKANSI